MISLVDIFLWTQALDVYAPLPVVDRVGLFLYSTGGGCILQGEVNILYKIYQYFAWRFFLARRRYKVHRLVMGKIWFYS